MNLILQHITDSESIRRIDLAKVSIAGVIDRDGPDSGDEWVVLLRF